MNPMDDEQKTDTTWQDKPLEKFQEAERAALTAEAAYHSEASAARAVYEAALAQIEPLRQRKEDTAKVFHAELAALMDVAPEALGSSYWSCPDSPTGHCLYDTDEDPCRDFCLICGDPVERK